MQMEFYGNIPYTILKLGINVTGNVGYDLFTAMGIKNNILDCCSVQLFRPKRGVIGSAWLTIRPRVSHYP